MPDIPGMTGAPDLSDKNTKTKTIVIVDDESGIRQLVSVFLCRYHFQVLEADSGRALFDILKNHTVDLILLDLMLPDIYGIEICKEIRKTSHIPIIMLTAAQGEMNMVLGFEAGADDYIEKPFSIHVLLSRIQAILRRTQLNVSISEITPSSSITSTEAQNINSPPHPFKKAHMGPWIYCAEDAELKHASGRRVFLTKNEATLLTALLRKNNHPIDREILMAELNLPTDDIESRAIDVQISRLRHKLRDRTDLNLIQAVRNKGYALISPVRFER